MNLHRSRRGISATIVAAGLGLACLVPVRSSGADYGRIVGQVADPQGAPLMGATVLIVGPMVAGLQAGGRAVERVITDAHGQFTAERLLPGWYSLRVTSPTRLPIMRNHVRVEAGESVRQNFVLGDILTPLQLQVPKGSVTTWGEDWKWVLRTASATRPILRYREPAKNKSESKDEKPPLPEDQHLIALNTGSSQGRALAGDPGMGSVLAYIRPLSEDTDLLVAGSMSATGLQSSSVATVIRRDVLKGDPQELALVVHQLSFTDGIPVASGQQSDAQAIMASYSQTRRLLSRLIVTAGFEVDYLNAGQDAMSSRPFMKAEYHVNPSDVIAVRYGAARIDTQGSLLDRIGALTSFPRVTMRGYQPQLERLKHSEVSYTHGFGNRTHVEAAAYRDEYENAALWGFGQAGTLEHLAGSFLPNPAANGVTLNAGNYSSSGLRAALIQKLGSNTEVSVLYTIGDALAAEVGNGRAEEAISNVRSALRTRQTQTIGGRVSTRIPHCKTQITSTYQHIPSGRVTAVDPVGQASLQIQPYLGIQIRQPLPNLAFLPGNIEAMADFRNLLAQGYVPVYGSGEDTLLVTPAYRSFRGGFSVQF